MTLSGKEDLDQIFCWEFTRQIKNDWTIQFENQHYQIEKTAQVRPKQKITVKRHLDGSISLWVKSQSLAFCIAPLNRERKIGRKEYNPALKAHHARMNKHNTPWGRFNPHWLKSNKLEKNFLNARLSTSPQAPGDLICSWQACGTCG